MGYSRRPRLKQVLCSTSTKKMKERSATDGKFSFLGERVSPTCSIRLTSSSSKAGLGIAERTMGSPPSKVVFVKFVLGDGIAKLHSIQPGMIILGYTDIKSVSKRMKCGPFPFELCFYDPLANLISRGNINTPLEQVEEITSLSCAEDQKKQATRRIVSSTFGVINSILFGWVETVKKEALKKNSNCSDDMNAALVASALSTKMVQRVDEGLFQEALVIANEALTIQRQHAGSNHQDVGRLLNFIGVILSQGEDSESYMALTSFEESLTIMQETMGYGDEETSFALHNMWLLLHNERERQKEDESERNEIHTYKGALPIKA
mmetsp:Transcript_7188/g.10816  ORF Transcript_7188/g.10816 Transcript_7188/m.10816 type:complete len:321 (-) Transcript_7188:525-1487(-)